MNLNSWDKSERPEAGWVKFQGKDGNVTTNGDDPNDCQTGSGASVDGYLNVLTNQIEFIVNYNMMNVRTETFQQTIDKSRLNNLRRSLSNMRKTLHSGKKKMVKDNFYIVHIIKERGVCPDISLFLLQVKMKDKIYAIARLKYRVRIWKNRMTI